MEDDLGTPKALATVFETVGRANSALDAGTDDAATLVATVLIPLVYRVLKHNQLRFRLRFTQVTQMQAQSEDTFPVLATLLVYHQQY